jgi:hypothetical protein
MGLSLFMRQQPILELQRDRGTEFILSNRRCDSAKYKVRPEWLYFSVSLFDSFCGISSGVGCGPAVDIYPK